ncbi:CPBP family intramembrane metalloprotease [Halomicroarcula sp. S1AR25-4]|uniref:CPBP family intramembrane glutamic endopeptidase n=1 Tax=Haloarcula sp. S1AR25-4 TaxID=2950538 RepID=UPI0028762D4F|nr:CPBP family intramembrane glutamic endopeptidase [Halomicroarcula sp. S1AR25-4]MDS0280383.1 CPBP family intramembrane metalloprotease [Halomicroarcula sp. S1AR25-4]
MGFGPSISAPTITGTQVVYPARLVAAWAVLTVASLGLKRVIHRCKYWTVKLTGTHPFGWFASLDSDRRIDTGETETYTVADLKDRLDWERRQWRRLTRRGGRAVVIAPVVEELTFRGGPYLLAVTLGGAHLPLLVAGSVLWASLHTRNPRPYRRGAIPVFVSGLLSLYLWLIGLWWLAILVHAGNNLVAIALEAGEKWWRRWQHSFSPGEEYTVTVDDRSPQPDRHGLYRAYTPADETLHVADVEPGETTRVRVATTVGLHGYAYPITESGQEPDCAESS